MGEFVDYLRMTEQQRQEVRDHLLTQNLTVEDLPKWAFYVKNDGHVTRQKGCHKATALTQKEWDDAMTAFLAKVPGPSKDQPIPVKVGTTFTNSRG